MRRGLILVFAILLVVVSIWSANSQTLAVVEGTLKDRSGSPVANYPLAFEQVYTPSWTDVLPWKRQEPRKVVAITDSKGYFQAIDLPPGKYRVLLLKAGAEPEQVASFNLEPGYKSLKLKDEVRLKEDFSRFRYDAPRFDTSPGFNKGDR